MAAANFSKDVLEMFYRLISQEDQQRLRPSIRPSRKFDFELVRNNFGEWLHVWKMRVQRGNRDLMKFFQRTKNRFIDVCENEVRNLKSVKLNFSLLVRFSDTRGEEAKQMEHYFNQMQPAILNEHNIDTLNHL